MEEERETLKRERQLLYGDFSEKQQQNKIINDLQDELLLSLVINEKQRRVGEKIVEHIHTRYDKNYVPPSYEIHPEEARTITRQLISESGPSHVLDGLRTRKEEVVRRENELLHQHIKLISELCDAKQHIDNLQMEEAALRNIIREQEKEIKKFEFYQHTYLTESIKLAVVIEKQKRIVNEVVEEIHSKYNKDYVRPSEKMSDEEKEELVEKVINIIQSADDDEEVDE